MKMKWMLAVLSAVLLLAAGCASDESDFFPVTSGDGSPAVHETGAMRFSVQWPVRSEPSPTAIEYGQGEPRPIDRLEEFIRAKAEAGDEVGSTLNPIFARASVATQSVSPLTIDPLTELFRIKLWAGGYANFANISWPDMVAYFANVPAGVTLSVDGTAWWNDPLVGPALLSYGFTDVVVLPCADPCATPTQATITLSPSSASVSAPPFAYGSASPQEITVVISLTNWPLSLRQARMDIFVTNHPIDPMTVFEPLCSSSQVLTDVTERGCSGTVPATPEIMALLSGSARVIVLVEGVSQDVFNGVLLISDPLPDAP